MYPGEGGGNDRAWDQSRGNHDSSEHVQGPDDWATYSQGVGGPGPGAITVVAVAAVVVFALIGALAFLLLNRSGDGDSSAEGGAAAVTSTAPVSLSPTPSPGSQQTSTDRVTVPAEVLEECSDSGGDVVPRAGRGSIVTSCPFAEQVRDEYLGAGHRGGAAEIKATSPVTGVTYSVECEAGSDVVACRGGDNAVVYLY